MSNIYSVTLPSGTSYDIKDKSILYANCSTAADTTAKIAILVPTDINTAYTIGEGTIIIVHFTYYNILDAPTLTIMNSAGTTTLFAAKTIVAHEIPESSEAENPYWPNNATIMFAYDGTEWVEITEGINPKVNIYVTSNTLHLESEPIISGDGTLY